MTKNPFLTVILHKKSLENKTFPNHAAFTQLNTPIQQLRILKGFEYQNIESVQADLGIEVILKLFSKMDYKGCLNLPV
jgi:hypothetical protein